MLAFPAMRRALASCVASVVMAVGCARQEPPALAPAELPLGCALGVPGSKVVAEDTPDGIALLFTSKERPEEMRARAYDAAAQHGPGSHMGHGHEGRHGQGADHGLRMIQGPPARSVAEDIEGGARIRFVAVDATESDALRMKLRKQAGESNATRCRENGLKSPGRGARGPS